MRQRSVPLIAGKMAAVGKGTEESTPAGRYDSRHLFHVAREGDVTISDITVSPDPEDKEAKLIQQTISLSTPFPEWAFFKSDKLPDIFAINAMTDDEFDRYLNSLVVYYKRIYDALKNKQVDAILPMFEERNREMDQAYYYPAGTNAKKIAKALKEAANDPDLTILGVKPDYLIIHNHVNHQLVELVRNSGHPAIVFNIRGGGAEGYPIIFRKQGDQWIITR